LLDDLTDLPASLKLLGHIGGAAAAIAFGVVLNITPNWVPGFVWINVGLTILWFVTVHQRGPFLDGMTGSRRVSASSRASSSASRRSRRASATSCTCRPRWSAPASASCRTTSARVAPDLPGRRRRHLHRLHAGRPRGDGEWADQNSLIALLTPALILGVPLFDIGFVGIMRVVTGKVHTLPEWLAYTGRDHIHHRFEALGLTKKTGACC